MPGWGNAVIGAAVVLLPGTFAWFGTRALLRSAAEPLLEERLQDYYRAFLSIVVLALVLTGALSALLPGLPAGWMVALEGLATFMGFFHTRRALFGETWGLPAYIFFHLRQTLAWAGFWLLLVFGPRLVASWPSSSDRWLAAYGMGTALLLWAVFSRFLFCALLGARPLRAPELAARFAEIAARSRVQPPLVYEVAPRGGNWSNAVALPGSGACVLLGRSLLEALAADEAAALFAHEVAHLELYGERRLRRAVLRWITPVGVVACAFAARFPSTSSSGVAFWGWCALVVLAYRAVRSRKNWEAAADRRGAELCGDAQQLARGLAKLHALARLPRRWAPDADRQASHPSLADRVAALAEVAGTSEPEGAAAAEASAPERAAANGFRAIHLAVRKILVVVVMIIGFVAIWTVLHR